VRRWLQGLALVVGFGVLVAGAIWLGVAWNASRVPGSYTAMELAPMDYGGGSADPAHEHVHGSSVSALHGPPGRPDVRLRLVAESSRIRLPSGKEVDALTFNGRLPGPELRARAGDLVEVTLVNRDVPGGVSIHWHGVDVPNAEDGVSGVTQNAVPPGESYAYRFRVDEPGTYWYHSHQHSADEVERGLYGAFVVTPRDPQSGLDLVALAHTVSGHQLLGSSDGVERRRVAAGAPVRIRLVNSADTVRRFALTGTAFRVVGIDARDRLGGAPIRDETIAVPAGGRYDVALRMPASPVRLAVRDQDVGIVLDSGHGAVPDARFGPEFDPGTYGAPAAPVPRRFDRHFAVDIGRRLGFFKGGTRFGWQWTINGKTFPRMPMYVLRRGETVEFSFSNESHLAHPMHLHGHHMLVFARDGRRITPWWSDTLEIDNGEHYDVAVFATNPGVWMFHCHNLPHAAHGLVTHVGYEGVTPSFEMGDASGNEPE
jgi:FtsP/CotA-like multicopper oxidase with cupredoxin domain